MDVDFIPLELTGITKCFTRAPNDPFFEEGNKFIKHLKKFGIYEKDSEDFLHEPVCRFRCNTFGCKKLFNTVFEFEQHYNCCHRYVCAECKKVLATAHLLDLHLSETHDSFFRTMAERKAMFLCYLEDCKTVFQTPQQRKNHCLDNHNFPSSFWNDKPIESVKVGDSSKKSQKVKRKNTVDKQNSDSMEVDQKMKNIKQKHLGQHCSKGRQKILVNFTKDLADSLPVIDNLPDKSGKNVMDE